MSWFNSTLIWYLKRRWTALQLSVDSPFETQEIVFHYLVQAARKTEWGKTFDYKSISNIKDFKERVPIQDYDTLKPSIERMMKGEQNVLWHSEIKWFAKSSGTTSDKSKFIPVSKEGLKECHFKGGKDVLAIYCYNHPETKIFSGKGLIMGGSHKVNQLSNDSFYGDVSAVMMQNMPMLAQLIRTPDLSIALMDDWEEKLEKIAQTTIPQNVTHLAGVPTWTLVLLNRILEKTGKANLAEVWQNLELYIHGGVSFTPYKEQFEKMIVSEKMNYLETYNASEGFFAIQNSKENDLLLMMDYGVFYEFLPLENAEEENPKTFQLGEVEIGKNYALIISTNSGLWRYKIGDTIQFTSLNPFKIKITGRVKHFINAFGEEVIVDNSDKAIAEACLIAGASVRDYTVAPIYLGGKNKGGHEWLIEFENPPENLTQFTETLDKSLQSLNSDYEAKRFKNIALQIPIVHALPKDTFYLWLKSKGKLGGQNKVPRLYNDRRYVEEILKFSPT